MDVLKSSFFLLTFVFLAENIECEGDFHFELSQEYFSPKNCTNIGFFETECNYLAKRWVNSDFLPQLNNATETSCLPNGKLEATDISFFGSSERFSRSLSHGFEGINHNLDPSEQLENRWNEFGSCMTEIEQLSDRSKYLSEATRLYNKYNMSDILQQSNITPGKNYTYQEISDAVSKVTQGKKPIIKCLWDYTANVLELERITLFFDKSLNLIDPLKNYYPGKCSPDLLIHYKNHTSKFDQAQLVPYEDPFDKYPTLREDNNGYYLFLQKTKPYQCPKADPSSCRQTKYPWMINTFTFKFNQDISFTCNFLRSDPHNFKKFNFTSLSSIESEIEEKWHPQSFYKFFDPEADFSTIWHDQGQCSTYFKGKFDSEFKFFKKSLELFDKYNVDVILRQANITPGKNYTYQEISEAVSKKINGKKPIVKCFAEYNCGDLKQILSGIAIFMDKNLYPIDGIIDTDLYDCPTDQLIYYRTFEDGIYQRCFRDFPQPVA
ncbi:hypothetical protein KQX54_003585 [Cotesia glomerata]|uniref:Uncharacterized protein n=1 Tax=Cotesia glomerata TaxID=32391 RepID=A0AAV7IHM1_COTGL|nr:hypothetical protein KQX54_003585 [Cotesia glomerata]